MTASVSSVAPNRIVPQELIDLALLAIRHGAARVSLGHESLGFEFQAPIGWMLWISQHDPLLTDPNDDAGTNTVLVSHQVSCALDVIQAPAWLAAAARDDSTLVPVIDELIELFQAGIRNGWDVTYERKLGDFASFSKFAADHGLEGLSALRHELRGHASNWGYDQAAHDRGGLVSTEVVLSLCEGADREPVVFSNDGGVHRKVTEEHVAALLSATAPNFVPVAYFDDDLEEWVK